MEWKEDFRCSKPENKDELKASIFELLEIETKIKNLKEQKIELEKNILFLDNNFSWDMQPELRVYSGRKKTVKISKENILLHFGETVPATFTKLLSSAPFNIGPVKHLQEAENLQALWKETIEETIEIKKLNPKFLPA